MISLRVTTRGPVEAHRSWRPVLARLSLQCDVSPSLRENISYVNTYISVSYVIDVICGANRPVVTRQ